MRRKIIILGALLVNIAGVKGQQQPLFNSSIINPFIENTSLAGTNNYAQGFLHYRKQWIDIEGAPESALLTGDWPMGNEKSGLGLMVSSDRTNILGHIGILMAYSHGIMINSDQYLRLGLGMKLNHNTIYFDKVKAEQTYEAALFNYFESATGLNANFGAQYTWQDLNIGLSGLNLLNSKIQYSDVTENKRLYFQYVPQVLLNVNYTFRFEPEISVKPDIGFRNIQGMPIQPEVSVFTTYQEKYSAGIVYRNNNSIGFMMSAMVQNRLTIGYSYQVALGEIAGYNGGTHEITFGYRFYTSHFQDYKPVDEEKIDELLDFVQKQVDENKELQKNNVQLKNEQEQLRQELEKEKDEIEKLKELMLQQQNNYYMAREEDETELEDIPDDLFKSPDEPIYIILGVFEDTWSAKKYQQVLMREAGVGTELLRRKNSDDYIVTVNRKFQTKNDLKREMARLKRITKAYNSSDVWIYVTD
jgi:type IX secretion system PorP/SprF family membrane protein